jgi:hypothetical protein
MPDFPDYKKIFAAISADPRYLANLDWGAPRRGHPEGTVRAHIAELEKNLETIRQNKNLGGDTCWKLKILIHVHDSFKAEAVEGSAITDPRSHASLARAFLVEFLDDPDLHNMIQFHDESFALYRQFEHKGAFNQDRFAKLIAAIHDWNLFLAFLIIDGCTEGKSRKPLHWLFDQVAGKVQSTFTQADILPEPLAS